MKKGPEADIHPKIDQDNLSYYDDNYWLIPEDQRNHILDLYNAKESTGIVKLSRKANDLGLPLSRSIIFSSEENIPFVLYEGKEKLLGKGVFGKVKIGQNLLTGEFVAIKVIDLNPSMENSSKTKTDNIRKEKLILKRLDMLKGSNKRGERRKEYIMLPLIDGANLKQMPAIGHSFDKDVRQFLLNITLIQNLLNAMNEMHENGVLHRDIKPENILFSRKGQCKIIDFGVSMSLEGEDVIKDTRSGDMHYLPPYLNRLIGEKETAYQALRENKNKENLENALEIRRIFAKYPFSIAEDYHAMYLTLAEMHLLDNIKLLHQRFDLRSDASADKLLKALNNFQFLNKPLGTPKTDSDNESGSSSENSEGYPKDSGYPNESGSPKDSESYPEGSGDYIESEENFSENESDNEEQEPFVSEVYRHHNVMIDNIIETLPQRISLLKDSSQQAQNAINKIKEELLEALFMPELDIEKAVEEEMEEFFVKKETSKHTDLSK